MEPEPAPDSTSAAALVISAADKAGMEGIDRAAIDAIILKESGNSLFMQQQRRRDEKVNKKIATFREKLNKMQEKQSHKNQTSNHWREALQRQMDSELFPSWIASRPKRSIKVVVDMDAFYMNCELLYRPDISPDTPACVGGTSMILTSNYAARRYGVRSAMPGYIGQALVQQLSGGREKLVFCPSNFELYKTKSMEMKQVLSEFDPNLTAYSLDEAYLDLGPYLACSLKNPNWTHEQVAALLKKPAKENLDIKVGSACEDQPKIDLDPNNDDYDSSIGIVDEDFGEALYAAKPFVQEAADDGDEFRDATEALDILLSFPSKVCLARMDSIVFDMRERVRTATGGLTCSAGVAPNFMLAKIASDHNKPNGQLIVESEHDNVLQFLNPLPVRKVSGIGRVTEKILNAFGIVTVSQLYQERALIQFLFEDSSTTGFLLRASVGCSSSDTGKMSEEDASSSHQKGISRERTMQPGKPWAEVCSKFVDIAALLSDDMIRKNLSAQTVTVKVKLSTFDMLSRARTLPRGVLVQSTQELLKVALELLHEIRQKETLHNSSKEKSSSRSFFSVRLLGIRCSSLVVNGERRSELPSPMTSERPELSSQMPSERRAESSSQMRIDRFFSQSDKKSPTKNDAVSRTAVLTTSQLSVKQALGLTALEANCSNPYYSPRRSMVASSTAGLKTMRSDASPLDTTGLHHSADTSDKTMSPSAAMCPICGVSVCFKDNDSLNRHIDSCLNASVVRQAIREESVRTTPTSPRSSGDFFRPITSRFRK